MILITGGSGSGKSAYAEETAVCCKGEGVLYYLATMQIFDAEGEKKVARHRQLRAGKGFLTLEYPYDIRRAAHYIRKGQTGCGRQEKSSMVRQTDTVLLECMSNLAANEMFRGEPKSAVEVSEKILDEVTALSGMLKELVIVTNNVFEDGICYDAATMEYIKALGTINMNLAVKSDAVVEVVAGIPVAIKGTLPAGRNL